MTSRKVEIRPEVAIYSAFARLNYRPWYALAEFVDNSLQSYLTNRERLRALYGPAYRLSVEIRLLDDCIEVEDNAAGISWSDFPRAFLPASPPPDTSGLSEFGLGLKAAACWFAKSWSVRTRALGDTVERVVLFDVPSITRERIDVLPVSETNEVTRPHGTLLRLERLNAKIQSRTVTKIRSHLASIYRVFLREGDLELIVGNESLSWTMPEFLHAPYFAPGTEAPLKWYREFELPLDGDHRISGWAGLLARASVANAGFAVFRRRRLIEGSYGEAYRPDVIFRKSNSYTYQRLVGEMNVEGFSVSHTKDGVQWADWEDDILKWLRAELDRDPLPLLKQAEGYRARPKRSVNQLAFVTEDTERVLQTHVAPVMDEQLARGLEDEEEMPESLAVMLAEAAREAVLSLVHVGQRWRIRIEAVSNEGQYEWLAIASDERGMEDRKLHIRINLAHPFMIRFTSPSGAELPMLFRLAAGLAVAEATARAAGVGQAAVVRRNLNQLMREALAQPDELTASASNEEEE